MDQEKIGKFIAELRKNKNMTQKDLAIKLGVTDRAISKWENGRGMPDLSLIRNLCDELGITVNELLSGEKLNKDIYQKKSEENLLNTIKYTDKKINKVKKIAKVILLIIIVLFICLITLFSIDIKRMNNNEPVFFSTWGFLYAPAIDLHEEEIEIAIEKYLIDKNESESSKYNDEKWFVSFNTYLVEELKKDSLYNVYAWVFEESYYLQGNEVKVGSGSSIPHKFTVEKQDNQYVVSSSVMPRDGSLYVEDMKKIFPKSVRKDMEKVHFDGTIERLKLDIEKQVKLYFHI